MTCQDDCAKWTRIRTYPDNIAVHIMPTFDNQVRVTRVRHKVAMVQLRYLGYPRSRVLG